LDRIRGQKADDRRQNAKNRGWEVERLGSWEARRVKNIRDQSSKDKDYGLSVDD
jgi:hypothetical protein